MRSAMQPAKMLRNPVCRHRTVTYLNELFGSGPQDGCALCIASQPCMMCAMLSCMLNGRWLGSLIGWQALQFRRLLAGLIGRDRLSLIPCVHWLPFCLCHRHIELGRLHAQVQLNYWPVTVTNAVSAILGRPAAEARTISYPA